jgi:murein DD-endopeptidase MepM/ murein hydrolase activator NlpD
MKPKIIYQPVKPFRLNQAFGENTACISTDGKKKVIWCDGLNPPEGYKSVYGKDGHLGLDLMAFHGQEVYNAQEGTVYRVDANPSSGLDVRVESEKNGIKFRHIYEHLLGYQHKVGDYIKTGQLIGWADNTGYSSGNHLHFQMEVFDGKRWVPVDPMLYMEPVFALDILKLVDKIKFLKELIAKLLDRSATKLRTNGN